MFLLQCFTLRKFHMMRVKARIITSDRRCKRHARDQIAFRLGLRAPLFARNKFNHFIASCSPKKKKKNSGKRSRTFENTHYLPE